jgi:hypothetical protein
MDFKTMKQAGKNIDGTNFFILGNKREVLKNISGASGKTGCDAVRQKKATVQYPVMDKQGQGGNIVQ